MNNLEGKKLLILGASGPLCNIVRTAKRLGVFTIVADYYKDSPAKAFADKVYLASTTDVDAMERIARENAVDGVLTGFSDANLSPTQQLAERLGLPFYGTREQIDICTDKKRFKALCQKHEIAVIKQYSLDAQMRPEDMAALQYPILIKPVDSYASKGMSVCREAGEVAAAVQKALSYSKKQLFLTEQYMDYHTVDDVVADYNIQNGHICLSVLGDRYVNDHVKGASTTTSAVVYPSRYHHAYLRDMHDKVKALITDLGIRNGHISFQMFVDNGVFRCYEPGFRLVGGETYLLASAVNGVNIAEMLIEYALTGAMTLYDITKLEDPLLKGKHACGLVLHLRSGVIGRIEGIEALRAMPETVSVTQLWDTGHAVLPEHGGTLNQAIVRMHMITDTQSGLKNAIKQAESLLQVYDTSGHSMLLPSFDVDLLA